MKTWNCEYLKHVSDLAFKDKLSTGVRTREWRFFQLCILYGERDESRDHLYLACSFTYTLWTTLCSKLLRNQISPDWKHTLRSITQNKLKNLKPSLFILLFKPLYTGFGKRNGTRHQQQTHTPETLRLTPTTFPNCKVYGLRHVTSKEAEILCKLRSLFFSIKLFHL